jgi:hypothetical protein
MALKASLATLALLLASSPDAHPSYNQPLDHPYTLRNSRPALLIAERQRLIASQALLSFIYPRPCVSPLDSSSVCVDDFRAAWRDSSGDQDIGLSLAGAEEYRAVDQDVFATEAGFVTAGHKSLASFYLDARFFSENADGRNWTSYDGEAVDVQSADVTGSASYLSYVRYRGNMSLDLPFGRLTAARDAAHWGPAFFGNLVFNQAGIPFNQYTFTTHLGPVTVQSLYGDLLAAPTSRIAPDKNLYAHRYELRPGRNWVLGISEQLIMVNLNKPYLFVPVFPLFIAKGFMHEDSNNGNIAFDLAYRRPGLGLFYTELLLDDMESPSSLLLKDYAQNKWGALAGAHLARSFGVDEAGVIAEACRIEPWVYTHFREYPSQASNLDRPLGNPLGPNLLDLRARAYFRRGGNLYLALTAAATWKGTGPGSDVNDTTYTAQMGLQPKHYLEGADGPDWTLEPMASYGYKWFRLEGAWTLRRHPAGYARLMASY